MFRTNLYIGYNWSIILVAKAEYNCLPKCAGKLRVLFSPFSQTIFDSSLVQSRSLFLCKVWPTWKVKNHIYIRLLELETKIKFSKQKFVGVQRRVL